MTQAVETETLIRSPLVAIHERLGANLMERDGWAVPKSYGDEALEYAAVREGGAGLIDLSARGRIRVAGTEAIMFLNGLITNDMKSLRENHWMPAAFPNVQGRLIASVCVVRFQDEGTGKNASPTFMIDTEAATHSQVLKTIERFTLAGDFRVTDVTRETAMVSLQGSKARDLVSKILGDEAAALANNQVNTALLNGNELTVIRSDRFGEDGFDMVVRNEDASALWNALQDAGAQPVGSDAVETLRIEAGAPRYGVDMDETNVVTETGLDEAVSYTKGCYIGQEIIARIKYRGHVAKKLSGLRFEGNVVVEPGAVIKSSDGKEVGRITSKADSPRLGHTIALGYLKYDYLAAGTEVRVVSADGEVTAEVTNLPFISEAAP